MTGVGPLLAPEALLARLDDPRIRVVDCRWVLGQPGAGRVAYDAGHVPGAVYLDVDGDLAASAEIGPGRHPLPEVGAFIRRLEAAGIGDEHRVVAYDDVGGWVAARLWWMLDVLGHHAVAVLDGGWGAWLAAGGPVSDEVPAPPPARLTLADHWSRTIDRDALRARLGEVVLLDARGAPAIAARSSRSMLTRATSRPPATPRRTGTWRPTGDSCRRPPWPPGCAPSVPTAPRARSSPRAGAGCRPASTPWRCASPVCPTRSSTWAPTATGPVPACRSPSARTPATLRPTTIVRP